MSPVAGHLEVRSSPSLWGAALPMPDRPCYAGDMVANPKPAPEPRPPSNDAPHDDAIIVLEGATWTDYERILAIRGERPIPRVAYANGRLLLMTPSRYHELLRSLLGRLIETWCLEAGVDITPVGSWTLRSEAAERGLEPDECYVVGDYPEDDAKLERPDLAVEVVWTSGGIDKLAIYASLGVREVWYWRSGALTLYTLEGGTYGPTPASHVLPGIDHAELLRFVELRPMTRAIRAYREVLRAKALDEA